MEPESIRCPVCQGDNLSDVAPYASFENSLRFKASKSGLLGNKYVAVGADSGRICYDCGYLLLFIGEKNRKRVKER